MSFPIVSEMEPSAATRTGSISEGFVKKTENSLRPNTRKAAGSPAPKEAAGLWAPHFHISLHAGLPALDLLEVSEWPLHGPDLAAPAASGIGRTTVFLLIAVNCPGS